MPATDSVTEADFDWFRAARSPTRRTAASTRPGLRTMQEAFEAEAENTVRRLLDAPDGLIDGHRAGQGVRA